MRGLTEEDIRACLAEGRAVRIAPGEEIDEREFRTRPQAVPAPSSVDTDPGTPNAKGMTNKDAARTVLPPPTAPKTVAPPGLPTGKWGYDPASLQGKNLVELNALVVGIDSSLPPFKAVQLAVNQLSADFTRNQQEVAQAG